MGDIDLHYCSKCGRIEHTLSFKPPFLCLCCNNELKPIPTEFLIADSIFINDEIKQQFINDYIKASPDFDQYLYDHKEEICEEKSRPFNEALARGKAILAEQSHVPKCTYCGSTNIKKIGFIDRGISGALWGLGSKKISKQFHCNNCGADF